MKTQLPKIWYIIITENNKSIIKKWWDENGFGDRVWNYKAYYGYNSDIKEPISKDKYSKPNYAEEITFKEFECLVLNKSIEINYEIY